jgi:hypothetical protein
MSKTLFLKAPQRSERTLESPTPKGQLDTAKGQGNESCTTNDDVSPQPMPNEVPDPDIAWPYQGA